MRLTFFLLGLSPCIVFARYNPDVGSNPIAGLIILALLVYGSIRVIKGFFRDPLAGFRAVLGFVFVIFVGPAVPIFLSMQYDIGGWIGLIWLVSIIMAGKVGMMIAGLDDEPKQSDERSK
ncbi:hypothetical protein F1529_00580 [Alcanivorax sp. VBW004]|uniref:hypothetical protein n=1 Tax=Alcanivorax sp. VBW004 TaxID=1287708 RepID=UPI0012BD0AE9|nr:hypothetical protein [Alcanivorax sp. VBW004]MTT50967.1 hypothetical protein [Alcanivorax sp. VBW004]